MKSFFSSRILNNNFFKKYSLGTLKIIFSCLLTHGYLRKGIGLWKKRNISKLRWKPSLILDYRDLYLQNNYPESMGLSKRDVVFFKNSFVNCSLKNVKISPKKKTSWKKYLYHNIQPTNEGNIVCSFKL